jgi:cob(I)alamin adenosyltransferase
LIQVYTGPGKGKTTAALGLILRALGHDQQVMLVRLLKPAGPLGGELLVLDRLPGVRVINAGLGVLGRDVDSDRVRESVLQALEAARRCWSSERVDLLVIDEINNALHRGLISLEEFWDLLAGRPTQMEVVLTGRNAPAELLAKADLVTSMECLRHPLQKGIAARQGIEY